MLFKVEDRNSKYLIFNFKFLINNYNYYINLNILIVLKLIF